MQQALERVDAEIAAWERRLAAGERVALGPALDAATDGAMLGGLLLFDTSVPGVSVSPYVIVPVAAFAAFFFLIVVRKAIALRKMKVKNRDEVMAGREGTVLQDLDPIGVVQVAAEHWTASSMGGPLRKGERVRVVEMDGLRLKVEPVETPATASTEGREP